MSSVLRTAYSRLGLGLEWERPSPGPDALRRDLYLGLGFTVLALIGFELSRSAGLLEAAQRSVPEQLVWTASLPLLLCIRRRWPLTCMAVAALAFLAMGLRDSAVGIQLSTQAAFFIALFTGVAWGRDRKATGIVIGAIFVVMFGWVAVMFAQASVADIQVPGYDGPADPGVIPMFTAAVLVNVLINLAYFGGAAVIGQMSWRSALQRTQLAQQATQLRDQQQELARQAVLDERLRIARELHDVAAHHVSVIGIQAAAARRVLDVDGAAASKALSQVEGSSRHAVSEMRQLLGLLRREEEADTTTEDDSLRQPQPGLECLDELLEQSRAAGLDVQLHRVGALPDLPAAVSLSLYRTVQEALVNVVRHSTAQSASVTVRSQTGDERGDWVEVEVLDDGHPRGPRTNGTGLGLLGIRERAGIHGGSCEIGPRPSGGFRVRLRLPTAMASMEAAPEPLTVGR